MSKPRRSVLHGGQSHALVEHDAPVGRRSLFSIDSIAETHADPRVDVEAEALESVEAERVRRFVRRLPRAERQVITLRFGLFDNAPLPSRQVGERMGIPRGSVWKLERQALERLRSFYGPGEELPCAA